MVCCKHPLKAAVGDLSNAKYLISNHTKPDHADSTRKILKLAPHIEVVASRTAISYLKDITYLTFKSKAAEDLNGKLKRMPEDARAKLQETLQRIINEGSGGLICIIL